MVFVHGCCHARPAVPAILLALQGTGAARFVVGWLLHFMC